MVILWKLDIEDVFLFSLFILCLKYPNPFFFSVSKFVLFTVEKVTIVSLFVL